MIGVGTRWSDFTTASKSAFQDPDVRFVNINVAAFDAAKHSGAARSSPTRGWRSMRCARRWPASAPTRRGPRAPPTRPRAFGEEVARARRRRAEGALPTRRR